MRMLSEGISLKTIAQTSGYANVAALYRAFRRWTGTTPRRFEQRRSTPPPSVAHDEHTALSA